MKRVGKDDSAQRLSDSVKLLGRVFLSVGDHNFMPLGTTISCTNAGDLILMTYENPRAEISAGTLQIRRDGTVLIEHFVDRNRKSATGWLEIVQLEDNVHVLGEWQSEEGDARGEIQLFEYRPIPPP